MKAIKKCFLVILTPLIDLLQIISLLYCLYSKQIFNKLLMLNLPAISRLIFVTGYIFSNLQRSLKEILID